MTYDPLKPQATDFLSQSVTDIQGNFAQANVVMNIDHYPFDNVTANVGYHKQVHLPELAAAPGTAVNIGALYTKVGTNPAETNLFFQAEASGFEYQLTKVIASSTGRFSNTSNYSGTNNGGWTYLPGGLILQYGFKTSPGSSGTVTYPLVFPSGNPAFTIVVTNVRDSARSANVDQNNSNSAGFNYFMETSGSTSINWMAIGN